MSLIKRKTDCEVIADNFENVFSGIGDCFETGIGQVQKEMKEDALERKIKMLKKKE